MSPAERLSRMVDQMQRVVVFLKESATTMAG